MFLIKKKPPEYHVYADGSASVEKQLFGLGWVITDNQGHHAKQKSKKILIRNCGSSAAEVFAAQDALRKIPVHSVVTLFSDFKTIVKTIKNNDFDARLEKSSLNSPLHLAWKALHEEIRHHHKVQAVFLSADTHPLMRIAHFCAQDGANKVVTPEDLEDRHIRKYVLTMQDLEKYYASVKSHDHKVFTPEPLTLDL